MGFPTDQQHEEFGTGNLLSFVAIYVPGMALGPFGKCHDFTVIKYYTLKGQH